MNGHQDERVDDVTEAGSLPHNTTPITVVHSSGVFTHVVSWCGCLGSNPWHLQLLRAGLFPASSTWPRTAFTFEVLDHFLIDALECKTLARSFYEKLMRLTNNAFPDTVLYLVSCLWHDLKNRKWFRFGHDTESEPGPGDLTLFCPSCPQPGINMPLYWKQKYERQVNYYYSCKPTIARQWLIMKRFVHMNMRQPKLNIFLSDGLGYMVAEREYQAHLASATESRERSTCSNHPTGVGATTCAQHGCFIPHCIVDFQKGEQQV
ncbi:hypothetical protein BD769DRAFT_1630137 [Suillus cothurnatus]|nr:hypothetical protein BD769DRAFT_1630137 [Suillus cothurnatus]